MGASSGQSVAERTRQREKAQRGFERAKVILFIQRCRVLRELEMWLEEETPSSRLLQDQEAGVKGWELWSSGPIVGVSSDLNCG